MKKTIKVNIGRTFPRAMTMEEWVAEGININRESESLMWQFADWAAYGDREWGALKKFCDSHGICYSTARTMASVAASVELSRRRDNLSFGHHSEVAALPARDQERWLARADKERWSRAELRRQMRKGDQGTSADGPVFKFSDSAVLELNHFLTSQPPTYWTEENRAAWRARLRPTVEFYHSHLVSG